MCNLVCSVITAVVGGVLVITSSLISVLLVPNLVENFIKDEVLLINNTIQYERFEAVPFPLRFSVNFMVISNPEQVLAGEVPSITEVGPYVYRLYTTRNITHVDGDFLRYTRLENFEFDAEASFPRTEDDMVTIINVPYHAVIQIAELQFPALVSLLSLGMNGIFGVHNSPITTFRVGNLLFDGVRLCENTGLVGAVACNIMRDIGQSVQNLEEQEDGSLTFSLLGYKDKKPSLEYEIYRGLQDSDQLGRIRYFDGFPYFPYWLNDTESVPSRCNMINGTDSMIYPPFVNREKSTYAINTDICRSVELRYQRDVEVDGIPTAEFSANEWFLDNNEGCFCINTTEGINADNGCLLKGVMELYTCVGAMLVMSYPHFLYADLQYRNGVLGMAPIAENHHIYLNIEPNTGTPIKGAKRAQFNIFQRAISGIPATANLRTVLTPIIWVEEFVEIPDDLKDELRTRLLQSLNLLAILIPVIIGLCCAVLLVGLVMIWRSRRTTSQQPTDVLETSNKN